MNANNQIPTEDAQIADTHAVSPDTYYIDSIVEAVDDHFGVQITDTTARELAAIRVHAGEDTFDNIRDDYFDDELLGMYCQKNGRIEFEDSDPFICFWDDVAGDYIGADPLDASPFPNWTPGEVLYNLLREALPLEDPHVCDFAIEAEVLELDE